MTKSIVFLMVVFFSFSTAWASHYSCEFFSNGHDGSINIDISGAKAQLSLKYEGKDLAYKNCSVSSDDFGNLVECEELGEDLMVIINKEDNGAGIISEKNSDLVADADCLKQ